MDVQRAGNEDLRSRLRAPLVSRACRALSSSSHSRRRPCGGLARGSTHAQAIARHSLYHMSGIGGGGGVEGQRGTGPGGTPPPLTARRRLVFPLHTRGPCSSLLPNWAAPSASTPAFPPQSFNRTTHLDVRCVSEGRTGRESARRWGAQAESRRGGGDQERAQKKKRKESEHRFPVTSQTDTHAAPRGRDGCEPTLNRRHALLLLLHTRTSLPHPSLFLFTHPRWAG